MPNFLLTYTGGDGMAETPEAQAEVMAAWGAWFGALGEAVVDGGAPTAESSQIAPDGAVSAPAASAITGYTVLQAADLDGALALAKDCPHLHSGGSVEVYATIDMG